jgi:hypothetical protein
MVSKKMMVISMVVGEDIAHGQEIMFNIQCSTLNIQGNILKHLSKAVWLCKGK